MVPRGPDIVCYLRRIRCSGVCNLTCLFHEPQPTSFSYLSFLQVVSWASIIILHSVSSLCTTSHHSALRLIILDNDSSFWITTHHSAISSFCTRTRQLQIIILQDHPMRMMKYARSATTSTGTFTFQAFSQETALQNDVM